MTTLTTVFYNLVMGGIDLLAVAGWYYASRNYTPSPDAPADDCDCPSDWIWRALPWRALGGWLAIAVGIGMVALVTAAILGENHFGIIRLAAWGLFLHAPLLLLCSVVLWWPMSRPMAVGLLLVAVGLVAVAGNAFLIEPTWLEVSRYQIRSTKISRPVRIVVIADIQTDRPGDYERRVLRRALDERPDVIFFAGDYVQTHHPQYQETCRELNACLRQIGLTAPQGIFAIEGNVEKQGWEEIFVDLPVTVVNTTRSFELEQFRLTCLRVNDSYWPEMPIRHDRPERFHLVLGHVPNFALGQIEADLLVAGHTHGGQVRLPGIGPLLTHAIIPRRWCAGLTELPSGAKLLVSRGIGMERLYAPRLRFCCRPELVVLELLPDNPGDNSAPSR